MKTEYSINYNAQTIEEAKSYLSYRYKQLVKFGYTVKDEIVVEDNSIVTFYNSPDNNDFWGSVYILEQDRGKQIFLKRLQQFMIAIVTIEECGIEEYLMKRKINHKIFKHSLAYKTIQKYYGDEKTQRTGVPLIYHIEEGGAILSKIGATDVVKDAYYLHPILQSDECFIKNKSQNFDGINQESLLLAMEYRRVANSYLSTMNKSDFAGFTCEEIRQMLIADKIQNYKDFMSYHYGNHPRSHELYTYFNNWFEMLEIDYNDWIGFNYG